LLCRQGCPLPGIERLMVFFYVQGINKAKEVM
jgi:hypothetical protein